jgi:glucose/arabinose dehydrogenase
MGPLGGDEINIIEPGKNYGWPVVSNGDHYDGSPIPDHPTRPEFEAPIKSWNPVISPSGLVFHDGAGVASWRGSAFLGGLSSEALIRLTIAGNQVSDEERIAMGRRIRDVLEDRDGSILVLTDAKDGELLRLRPRPRTSQ